MPSHLAASVLMTPGIVALLATAVTWDIRQRRIPNWLTFSAAGLGLALQGYLAGLAGLVTAIAGLAVGMAVFLPGFLMQTTGAGDAKLMAAAGAFLGPYPALLAGLASLLCGAVMALGIAAVATLSGRQGSPWSRYGRILRTLAGTGRLAYVPPVEGEVMGRRFPYAVAIAAGVGLVLMYVGPAQVAGSGR